MIHSTTARVCVIGAGCSGITAVKNLLQVGLTNVVCYEKGNQIGGNWVYSPQIGHSSVFSSTHIISSKNLSQFADYPMPADYPDYPSHKQLLTYFQNYAHHFGVDKHIRFNTTVISAQPINNNRWQIRLADDSIEEFDYLLVASGHHWNPRMPHYPGNFEGQLLHSHEFKTTEPFKDQRVLVIGGGNSACDCAVETSRVSSFTAISMRRGYYIVPKFMLGGLPTDVLNQRMLWVPEWLRGKLQKIAYHLIVGDLAQYGLQRPKHSLLQAHTTLNSELLYMLRHGKVAARRDIARFEGKTVHFTDGIAEQYDAIIAATGYQITFPFFDTSLINYTEGDVPLYLRTFHPQMHNLFFIGLVQPMGCIWPLSDAQSKLVANYIIGNYKLPTDMSKLIKEDVDSIKRQYIKSSRHTIEVDYHKHLKELQNELPKASAL